MEQGPCSEDNSHSVDQEIITLYENRIFITITDFKRPHQFRCPI